jgi:hypothetical protein
LTSEVFLLKISERLRFLTKNRKAKHILSMGGGASRSGDDIKGWRRVNMMEMFSTHVCKWKNEISWNYSRNGGVIKENDGEVNSTVKPALCTKKLTNGYMLQIWKLSYKGNIAFVFTFSFPAKINHYHLYYHILFIYTILLWFCIGS